MAMQIPFTFKIYRGDVLEREERQTVTAPGVIKIGKLESSHLRLDDEQVSRMHAVIEVADRGQVQLLDLGSSAGTFLHGVKISKAKLDDGAELKLGDTRIVIAIGPAFEQSKTPAPALAAVRVPEVGTTSPTREVGIPPSLVAGYPGSASLSAQYAAASVGSGMPSLAALSVDRADGARAIEITTMFEDTVLGVRHLEDPAGGKVKATTWVAAATGATLAIAGLGVAFSGQTGVGALLLVLGSGMMVYAWLRREEELRSPHFTLGAAFDADVNLTDAAIPAPRFPLVRASGSDFSLVFTRGMSGDISVDAGRTGDGGRIELHQLIGAGRAQVVAEYPDTYAYPIPSGARVKIDIGKSTFLINSVSAARRVESPFWARIDWSAQTSNGVSLAAHLLLLFLVFAVPPDAKALSLDLFDIDNRFVKYLTRPPEQKEEEIPAWLRKRGPDEAGGKGQRHKGDEGKMGKKDSKNKTGLYGLKGPKENPDPHLAKQLAETQAKEAGVLGLLGSPSGSHIASIFGRDTALGTDAEDALGGLIGDTIGEAYGVGGLGLVGSGRGGGGTGEGTIGLGALGTIGKGGGGGDGAGYGRGAGRLGGRSAGVPTVLAGHAEVRGALDKEIIRRVIRRHINEIKYCYSKELQTQEDLGGRVVVEFTIAATGQVIVSKIQSSTIGNAQVDQCIAGAVRRWLFPKPKGGGIVVVSYPFVLRAAGN